MMPLAHPPLTVRLTLGQLPKETNTVNHLRISPRNLGQMKQTQFCKRCFKLQVEMGFKMPFESPMPGIMFNLDAFQKAFVDAHFATFDKAPEWLTGPELYSVADFPRKLTLDYPKYDLTMVGMPDALFRTA